MNKKMTGSALAALLVAGTTSFTAFAAMPDFTAVVGEKAFDLNYLMNATEEENELIREHIVAGNEIFVKQMDGSWVYNSTFEAVKDVATEIPAVEYKNAEGETTNYQKGDGEEGTSVETDFEITAVKAIGNNKVEVKLDKEVEAVSADSFKLTAKGGDTELEVKDAVVDGKYVVLTTEELKSGDSYTLTAGEKSINFTAIKEDATAPSVEKVEATDDNVVKVTFDRTIDEATAEDVANYSVDKDVEVVSATLNSDRKSVTVKTTGTENLKKYNMTIENVENVDGVAMKRATTKSFAAKTFRQYVTVSNVSLRNSTNNNTVIVKFNSAFALNKEVVENVDNYTVEGLDIESISYAYSKAHNINQATIKTSTQERGKTYKLTIDNLVDTSSKPNEMKNEVTKSFRGAGEDKTAPTMTKVVSLANNKVKVTFSDANALEEGSLLDPSNYSINNDVVIESVDLYSTTASKYSEDGRSVVITTSEMDKKGHYLEVSGIVDEFGNEMKVKKTQFRPETVRTTKPAVKDADAVSTSKIVVEFDRAITQESVKDATNFVIYDGSTKVTSALSAKIKTGTDNVVEITVPTLSNNKKYSVEINGVSDYDGNVTEGLRATVITPAGDNDVENPYIDYINSDYKNGLTVAFNESVKNVTSITIKKGDEAAITLNTIGGKYDGNTVVFTTTNNLSGDYKVTAVSGTDIAGNPVDLTVQNEFSAIGNDDTNAFAPYADYIEQVAPNKVKIIFSEPVKEDATVSFKAGNTTVNSTSFKYAKGANAYTREDKCEVIVTATLKADTDYKVNVANVENFFGINVHADYRTIDIYTDVKDEVGPSIHDVTATHNKNIKVTFDEDLQSAGSYKIYEYVNGEKKAITGMSVSASLSRSKDVVNLSTTKELDGDKEYVLTVTSAPRDLTGNAMENYRDVQEYFNGSDVVSTITAAPKNRGFNKFSIELSNGTRVEDNATVTTSITTGNGITLDEITFASTNDSGIVSLANEMPLLKALTYTATAGDYTVTFSGIVEDTLGINEEYNVDNNELTVSVDEMDKYVVKYFELDAANNNFKAPVVYNEKITVVGDEATYLVVIYNKDASGNAANAVASKIVNISGDELK